MGTDCTSGTCLSSVCGQPLKAGASCNDDSDCASHICACGGEDTSCTLTAMQGAGMCGTLPVNYPCGRDEDCTSGICDLGFGMSPECTEPENPAPNPCTVGGIQGNYGICGPQANGVGCSRDKDCTAGICDTSYYEDGMGGACGPQGKGAACSRSEECSSGTCTGGGCT
jgi:hypothetical protein